MKIYRPSSEEVRIFDFDRILAGNTPQDEAYYRIGYKIVQDVMAGYNGTIMAYGQTGSGKTFTIFGNKNSMDYNLETTAEMGIVPRAIKQVFQTINENSDKIQYQIRVSFMQVYMEQVSDLIQDENDDSKDTSQIAFVGNGKRTIPKEGLQIREDPKSGIFVKGLKQIVILY